MPAIDRNSIRNYSSIIVGRVAIGGKGLGSCCSGQQPASRFFVCNRLPVQRNRFSHYINNSFNEQHSGSVVALSSSLEDYIEVLTMLQYNH